VAVIAALARDGLLLDADACAFLLCVRDRAGNISRRGFLERVAVKGSFPRPVHIEDVGKRWRREDVIRWAENEVRISARAASMS